MRFPGFEEEWILKKLNEVANFYSGGTPLTSKKEYFDGNIPFIRSGEIDSDKTEQFITELGLKSSSAKLVDTGDILYALYGANSGEVAICKIHGAINQAILCIKSEENHYFIYSYLLLKKEYVTKTFLQGGQGNLSAEIIKNLEIKVPSLLEQQKIAMLFSILDERITTQKKIIEDLITVKNIVIKKIFEGKLQFTSEDYNFSHLQPKTLSEFLSIPRKIKPDIIDKDKLLTVKLHLKGVHKNEKSETLSIGATNYFVREKGQFIYGKQNLFNGAFAIIPDCYDGFLSSADVPALEINSDRLNGKYLFYLFSRESFYKKLEDISTGSGSKRIHEADLLKIKILVPSLVEQNKVVKFLSSLDEKINVEKDLVINYENQKKYLLANLFV
ncbi:restriction endonuclease subunit S [Chryseobacterium koreense]|uniref:restriction endonuclease subunit S n=1 Tax=Chryseobacterium koreense TaxID=232216 RepID=UPI00069FF28E|nr:restriction endonuclease subunit S [Chryseobacterium koreense]MBB5334713.1 type I restriction enzyme S subunit [Chryseobacterium koreense]